MKDLREKIFNTAVAEESSGSIRQAQLERCLNTTLLKGFVSWEKRNINEGRIC